jgi:lipopolysaccharide/colanic/teichoic acid biosynthesis glycosyltransferase
MTIVALAIKSDSFGPVFYRQERVGLNGLRFMLLKFRSMVLDAEPDGRPVWAVERDVRITRVGRFIGCTRIDELPQLFNVLCGDMSMVGPRPERPYFVDQLTKVIPFFAERHKVKPGITGWAQINYPYGASIKAAREKLSYDLYYIKNRNLALDLVILIATVSVVISKWGAR